MKKVLDQLNRFFENTPDQLRLNKVKVWILVIGLFLAVSYGMNYLRIDNSMESFLMEGDPTKTTFNEFRQTFGSDEGLYIVYEAKDGDVFSPASLDAVRDLQNELLSRSMPNGDEDPLDQINDVTSLINASYLEVEGDLLRSRPFVGTENPGSLQEKETLREQALAHPVFPEFYLSKDSRFGGILIDTDLGMEIVQSDQSEDAAAWDSPSASKKVDKKVREHSTSMSEYSVFYNEVKSILEKPIYQESLIFFPVGTPVIMSFFNDVLLNEMGLLFTGTLAVMLMMLVIMFRSFSAVIWPMCIVVLTIVMTLGLLGWTGLEMNLMINILILLIMVVGVADSVHIISGYIYYRREGDDHEAALRSTYKKSGLACLLTSVTTSVGMLSLVFVPIPPIKVFGIAAAMGVMIAFLATVFILPLFLNDWNPLTKIKVDQLEGLSQKDSLAQRWILKIEPFVFKSPWLIVGVFVLVGIVFAYGVSLVRVDSNNLDMLKDESPIKRAYQIVDQHMGGTESAEIFIDTGDFDGMKDPAVLMAVEKAQKYLEDTFPDNVVSTYSLADAVKISYRALNEDKQEMYKIPQDRASLEQTLLLFESADPDDRQKLVTDDFSRSRITVRFYNAGSKDFVELFEEAETELNKIFQPLKKEYPEFEIKITGFVSLMMTTVEIMSWAQVKSFSLALAVVCIFLFVVFGSFKLGIVGIIPNIIPTLMTFGVMGFLGIPLDTDTLIIAPIVIGISVDDTIHFLTHYRNHLAEGKSIRQSLSLSIREVGQAVSFTSLILIFGFLLLIISQHQGLVRFGYLTAVAFISALLCDLLLLPALCQIFNIKGRASAKD